MSEACKNLETSISALIDGELEAEEQLPVIDHLLACPSCREFYHQARGLDDLVVSSQSQNADPVPDEIWHRIAAESGVGRRQRPRLRFGLGRFPVRAVGLAAVVVLGLGLFSLLARQSEAPAPAPGDETAGVDVVLEEDRGSMTDERFLEITMEVLKADRRYHREMLDVMSVVTAMAEAPEGSPEGPAFSVRDDVRRISLGEDEAQETSIRSEDRL